ncbi:hypothetical protein NHQ30_008803 [Ciborinia camelliae]|nr:hypothetical protein NHQ30_008803 [Ciborinia camelliae]
MSVDKGHFEQDHQPPVSHQSSTPGKQTSLPKEAINDHLPADDGGYQPYLAAGKLKDKKALITGGDGGIGRAVASNTLCHGDDGWGESVFWL